MRIRWRGLELPSRVVADRDTLTDTYGRFVAEPFERGFGVTVGNSIRRILLSSLEGSAVTRVKIQGVQHEITTIPGVEAAVMLHSGSPADSDQTYGALGTIVAERAIGIEGPIREYFLVPFTEPDLSRHRTEICWPVFQTA